MKLRTKFQDEDFGFGEIVEANIYYGGGGRIKVIAEPTRGGATTFYFETLKGMNEMFEDYEDPKYFWFIDDEGDTETESEEYEDNLEAMKSIGNYFETEEEAKKAVEKLKARERLKDKGFSFNGWTIDDGLKISICTNFDSDGIYDDDKKEIKSDLDICFGGEE